MSVRTFRSTGWDRPSQVALEGLLLIVMGVTTAVTVLGLVDHFGNREVVIPVTVTEQSLATASGARLVTTEGTLRLTEASTAQLALAAAPTLLGAAFVVGASYCLFRVVRSLRAGVPFHASNARLLMVAALIVLVGGALTGGVGSFSTMALSMDGQGLLGDASPLVAAGTVPLTFIGVGLLLLCLAEFFRRGTVLAEDVEGLV